MAALAPVCDRLFDQARTEGRHGPLTGGPWLVGEESGPSFHPTMPDTPAEVPPGGHRGRQTRLTIHRARRDWTRVCGRAPALARAGAGASAPVLRDELPTTCGLERGPTMCEPAQLGPCLEAVTAVQFGAGWERRRLVSDLRRFASSRA